MKQKINCKNYIDLSEIDHLWPIYYQNLKKLPFDLENALENLENSKEIKEAFGSNIINSYIKLRNNEIDNFNKKESFSKEKPVTEWEKLNTLDC